MTKNQIGYQIASFQYPADVDVMRSEVQHLQANGWEVQDTIFAGFKTGDNNQEVYSILVIMIKYEVDKPVAQNKKVPKVGEKKE